MITIVVCIIEAVTYVSSIQSIEGDNILSITLETFYQHQFTCQLSRLFLMTEVNPKFIS